MVYCPVYNSQFKFWFNFHFECQKAWQQSEFLLTNVASLDLQRNVQVSLSLSKEKEYDSFVLAPSKVCTFYTVYHQRVIHI